MLEDEGEAREVLEWWLVSSRFDGMTGQPLGPPEWPRAGGVLHQDWKLVEAVSLIRSEWARWNESTREKPKPKRGPTSSGSQPRG